MARTRPSAVVALATAALAATTLAHDGDPNCAGCASTSATNVAATAQKQAPAGAVAMPSYTAALDAEWATLYTTGERVLLEPRVSVKPICGSDSAAVTIEDLRQHHVTHQTLRENARLANAGRGQERGMGAGLDIQFIISGTVPDDAADALSHEFTAEREDMAIEDVDPDDEFTTVEEYIESQFSDPITVFITVTFEEADPDVLGFASSAEVDVSYATARDSLRFGADLDDDIQFQLPSGNSVPVRFVATSPVVFNQTFVSFNRSTFKATVGSVGGGTDVGITMNTEFDWDYDPRDGIDPGLTAFQSVMVHEVGHGLGFVSAAGTAGMDALDLFRFSLLDFEGTPLNPSNGAEFRTFPRHVYLDDEDDPDDDDLAAAVLDLVFIEFEMADGEPNQASHFREQGDNGESTIQPGLLTPIMDPTGGGSFAPNFYRFQDLAAFDAIGWDYPPRLPEEFDAFGPPEGSTTVPVDTQFEWQAAVFATSYRILIDDDPGITSPIFAAEVPTADPFDVLEEGGITYTPPPGTLQPLTTYYWVVDASNAQGLREMNGGARSFTTTVAAPEPFSLVSPSNFATGLDPQLELEWEESTNAEFYRLQISTSPTFSSFAVNVLLNATTFSYEVPFGALELDQTYFWRILALNPAETVSSPTRQFTTRGPFPPGEFEPLAPANNATGIMAGFEIDWDDSTDASSYRLRVDDNSNFSSPEIDVVLPFTISFYAIPNGALQPDTTYFWTVEATNPVGTEQMDPATRVFRTAVLAPAGFSILAPATGATDVPVEPLLVWNASTSVDQYNVQLAASPLFDSLLVDVNLVGAQTTYQVPAATLEPNSEYFWRVRASNEGGETTASPSIANFTTEELEPVNSCSGDFNGDGQVDGADFGAFGAAFGSMAGDPNYVEAVDFDGNGVIDGADFGTFGAQFGRDDCLDD